MSEVLWQPEWIKEHRAALAMSAFRLVETQHVAATMLLADTAAEQDLLEHMLEVSKPPMPKNAKGVRISISTA